MPAPKHLKRKPAMAASEVAQAKPVFDEGGVFEGGTQSKTARSTGDAIVVPLRKRFHFGGESRSFSCRYARRAANERSLMTCSMRQASAAAVSLSTPSFMRNAESTRCRS